MSGSRIIVRVEGNTQEGQLPRGGRDIFADQVQTLEPDTCINQKPIVASRAAQRGKFLVGLSLHRLGELAAWAQYILGRLHGRARDTTRDAICCLLRSCWKEDDYTSIHFENLK